MTKKNHDKRVRGLRRVKRRLNNPDYERVDTSFRPVGDGRNIFHKTEACKQREAEARAKKRSKP